DTMGRPRIEIDWETVDKLAGIFCTGEEIADVLDVNYDTLVNACKRDKNASFSEYMAKKRSSGKMSLRRKQFTTAVNDGQPTMLIWLGKQYLGQKEPEKIEQNSGLSADSVAAFGEALRNHINTQKTTA
ncbi:MAG: hypothetical protein P1P74_12500, partial [Desulfuromonadales bacterium]|nr:hypothetical protein [Desulfuromonadales bacterium]